MNHMHSGVINYQENLTPKSFLPINNKIYGYINKKHLRMIDSLPISFNSLQVLCN